VANTENAAARDRHGNPLSGFFLLCCLLFLLLAAPPPSNAAEATASSTASTDQLADKLGDCNWQVSYRGRLYDLTPLTREALSRPIENDIRFAIQRVPAANERLLSMTAKQRDARAHTIIASVFLSALLVTKLLESKVTRQDEKDDYRAASYAAGSFFLAATLFSWNSTRESKRELVRAVESFNASSPAKILPASEGSPTGVVRE